MTVIATFRGKERKNNKATDADAKSCCWLLISQNCNNNKRWPSNAMNVFYGDMLLHNNIDTQLEEMRRNSQFNKNLLTRGTPSNVPCLHCFHPLTSSACFVWARRRRTTCLTCSSFGRKLNVPSLAWVNQLNNWTANSSHNYILHAISIQLFIPFHVPKNRED